MRRVLAGCAAILCLLTFTGTLVPVRAEEERTATATFRCLGDFVLHMPVIEAARTPEGRIDFHPMLAPVADLIGDADYTVANVDGVMGASRVYTGYPRFSTPVELMDALLDCGVDMLTLSNNHALDCDFDGLIAQIDACDARGMDHIGASRTRREHDTPQVREINGIKVGFLNYTAHANGREAACVPEAALYGVNFAYTSDFAADAQSLRDAGAEAVVAFMHWGEEYNRKADEEEIILASRLTAAGVDVIVGGHPHVIQRIYWLDGERLADGAPQRTLCCYSLGNFLSNQQREYQNCGIIFEFTLKKDADGAVSVHSPGYIPVFVWREEAGQGYTYQVLASERYLDAAPKGMPEAAHGRLKLSWIDTTAHLGTVAQAAECIHIQ
ncbi:MAG: CapA family protein [Clostridia bacterium]|nr:CapA family protein [Clostridia bacterium]